MSSIRDVVTEKAIAALTIKAQAAPVGTAAVPGLESWRLLRATGARLRRRGDRFLAC